MSVPRIVIDTNVFVAALLSQNGASYKLLTQVGQGKFDICLSVPLVAEYEELGKRMLGRIPHQAQDIDDILDYISLIGKRHHIYFLWRPFLSDAEDDMVLELALAAGCQIIVTFNKKDFRGVEQFEIRTLTPHEFLQEIGELL